MENIIECLECGNKFDIISASHLKKVHNMTTREYSETKQKLCFLSIKRIEDRCGHVFPFYNIKACVLFDYLNAMMDWCGVYAENDGEFYIKELGYWADYYEPSLDLMIEWDEKHHYNIDGTLKEKDIQRQKEIMDFLGCKFFRIHETKSNWQLLPVEAIANLLTEEGQDARR